MKISEYIKSIEYEYIETYSLLRGEKNDQFYENVKKEIKELEILIKEPKFGWNKQIEKLAELNKYVIKTQYIFDNNYSFHPTAERKSTIKRNDSENLLLQTILFVEEDLTDDFETSCIPTYRDALVFFDNNNKMISSLNICFECKRMTNDKEELIQAHNKKYNYLSNFLKGQGHNIIE